MEVLNGATASRNFERRTYIVMIDILCQIEVLPNVSEIHIFCFLFARLNNRSAAK